MWKSSWNKLKVVMSSPTLRFEKLCSAQKVYMSTHRNLLLKKEVKLFFLNFNLCVLFFIWLCWVWISYLNKIDCYFFWQWGATQKPWCAKCSLSWEYLETSGLQKYHSQNVNPRCQKSFLFCSYPEKTPLWHFWCLSTQTTGCILKVLSLTVFSSFELYPEQYFNV